MKMYKFCCYSNTFYSKYIPRTYSSAVFLNNHTIYTNLSINAERSKKSEIIDLNIYQGSL